MPSPDVLIAFLVTATVFASMPGPAMVYTAVRTLADGRTAGLVAVFGMHLGGYIHIAAAATGLAVVVQATPALFTGLKLLGAIYLAWLGIGLIWSHANRVKPNVPASGGATSTRRALFESMTVQILNPAAAIFYVAFLPQFVDVSSDLPIWVQFVLLGTAVNLIFTLTKVVVAITAGTLLGRLRRSTKSQQHLQRAAGSMLVGLAVHLALWGSQA